jgi:hypothetical protein
MMDSHQLNRVQPPWNPRAPDLLRELSVIALLVLLTSFLLLA